MVVVRIDDPSGKASKSDAAYAAAGRPTEQDRRRKEDNTSEVGAEAISPAPRENVDNTPLLQQSSDEGQRDNKWKRSREEWEAKQRMFSGDAAEPSSSSALTKRRGEAPSSSSPQIPQPTGRAEWKARRNNNDNSGDSQEEIVAATDDQTREEAADTLRNIHMLSIPGSFPVPGTINNTNEEGTNSDDDDDEMGSQGAVDREEPTTAVVGLDTVVSARAVTEENERQRILDGLDIAVAEEVVANPKADGRAVRKRVCLLICFLIAVFLAGVLFGLSPWETTAGSTTRAFQNYEDLVDAVDSYIDNSSPSSQVSITYGYPIGSWDVSRVDSFAELFSADRNVALSLFNDNISQWNTSSATNMSFMFFRAANFNGDLSTWDTSRVTATAMMFREASSFNGNISTWDTSKVTTMERMFREASSFNGNISRWDTSQVITMNNLFRDAYQFNGDISQWNVSSVKDMYAMFHETSNFNGNLSTWDVSSVTDMAYMFQRTIFDGDISNWDVSSVTRMAYMFNIATNFNSNISQWNISKVETMDNMFSGASSFNQSLCAWGSKLSLNLSDVSNMFSGTNCLDTGEPDLTAEPPGPFCGVCA